MNHTDVKKNLADYLEGDLALDARAVVDAHLDQCEECALEVSEMEQTIRLLRTLPEPEMPQMMSANVMRRIRAGEAEPGLLTRIGRSVAAIFEPSFMLPASAIAAAALVVVVLQDSQGPGAPDLSGGLAQPGASALGEAFPAWAIRDSSKSATLTAMASVPGLGARSTVADRATPAYASPARSDRSGGFVLGAAQGTGSPLAGGAPPPFLVQNGGWRGGLVPIPVAVDRIVIRSGLTGVDAQRSRAGSLNGFSGANGFNGVNALSGAMPVAGPISQQMLNSLRARPVRASVPLASRATAEMDQSFPTAGSGDPRDAWLAIALERPVDFARFLVNKNLAEQELWVARLSDRAESRGLLDDLVQALEGTEDVAAGVLAADFVAARDAAASSESAGAP